MNTQQLILNSFTCLTLISFGTISGCKQEQLDPLTQNLVISQAYVTVDAQFCTSPPTLKKENYKYLFIIDHSKSNQPGVTLSPGDVNNTDPDGSRRYGPLAQFVSTLVPDPSTTTYFSLIDFNNTAYFSTGTSFFDSDQSNFIKNVNNDWNKIYGQTIPSDGGYTNYQTALSKAYSLIKADLVTASENLSTPIVTNTYQIIFVTDGAPTVQVNGNVTTQTFSNDIEPVLLQIKGLLTDATLSTYVSNIYLSTAYYYTDSADIGAQTLLSTMASYLSGQYLEFGGGNDIIYQTFSPPVKNIKYLLSDFFIENENAVWWNNGELMLDSDGDGLPDNMENSKGSNPLIGDSDKNGVNDFVEYKTKGKPCNDSSCAVSGRDSYSICNGFYPILDGNRSVQFPSSSKDGLNDCEKFSLGADPTNFNNSGDFIPDMLALKNGLSFLPGTTSSLADPFGDGISNYQKLKYGLPINISKNNLTHFQPRKTTLEHISTETNDIECYHAKTDNVLVYGYNNTIKIYVIENNSVIENKPILKVAVRTVSGQTSPVIFSQEDFK